MSEPSPGICLCCTHFRNSPAYLETFYKGLTALGSGYASVRKDDGICTLHEIYLGAHDGCERFSQRRPLPTSQ